MSTQELLAPIMSFLQCETPQSWIDEAIKAENLSVLLIDHCNCEKKAAGTAMALMFRYSNHSELLPKMSKLAREELRHFEQVLKILEKRGIKYRPIPASRYAKGLMKHLRTFEPETLIDKLIIGAYIEARSCERFAKLAPFLDDELQKFYLSLLKSESRHFTDYLKLAQQYSEDDITSRVNFFAEVEAELIESSDGEIRFHSGTPSI